MFAYTVYGLDVRSTIELPELDAVASDADSSQHDVTVGEGHVDPPRGDRDDDVLATEDKLYLRYENVGEVLISNGSEIRVEAAPGARRPPIRQIVLGAGLGGIVHQRGALVLHASAVAVDGGAAIFLGPSGAGKSTIAAGLAGRGHPVLADDVTVVRVRADGVVTLPGGPALRLEPSLVELLPGEWEAVATGGEGDKQYFLPATSAVREPTPVTSIYRLDEGAGDGIEPLSGREALLELVRNTYVGHLLDQTGSTAANFEQCSRLAQSAVTRRLTRPTDGDEVHDFIDAVATDIAETDETRGYDARR